MTARGQRLIKEIFYCEIHFQEIKELKTLFYLFFGPFRSHCSSFVAETAA